ncbi:hypothetical protein J6TS7_44410 [Paenibacillus dendritiformis]|nr:hypothetical protein J6TS7_44410 [Paenibacillus dendritiformis]
MMGLLQESAGRIEDKGRPRNLRSHAKRRGKASAPAAGRGGGPTEVPAACEAPGIGACCPGVVLGIPGRPSADLEVAGAAPRPIRQNRGEPLHDDSAPA